MRLIFLVAYMFDCRAVSARACVMAHVCRFCASAASCCCICSWPAAIIAIHCSKGPNACPRPGGAAHWTRISTSSRKSVCT